MKKHRTTPLLASLAAILLVALSIYGLARKTPKPNSTGKLNQLPTVPSTIGDQRPPKPDVHHPAMPKTFGLASPRWVAETEVGEIAAHFQDFIEASKADWDNAVSQYNLLSQGSRKDIVASVLLNAAPNRTAFQEFFVQAVSNFANDHERQHPSTFNDALAARQDLGLSLDVYALLIEQNPKHVDNFGLRHLIAEQVLAENGIIESLNFVRNACPAEAYEYLEVSILSAASTDHPDAVVQVMRDNAETLSDGCLVQIGMQFGATSPQSVASRIVELSDQRANPEIAESFARSWAISDSEAASKWLATLGSGPALDGAALGLIQAIPAEQRQTHDELQKWRDKISSPSRREAADQLLKDKS